MDNGGRLLRHNIKRLIVGLFNLALGVFGQLKRSVF